jgi:hypothetical protein
MVSRSGIFDSDLARHRPPLSPPSLHGKNILTTPFRDPFPPFPFLFTVWLIEDNEAYRTAALRIIGRMEEVRDTRGFKSCEDSSKKEWMANRRLRLLKLAASFTRNPASEKMRATRTICPFDEAEQNARSRESERLFNATNRRN